MKSTRVSRSVLATFLFATLSTVSAIDNGIGIEPPQGWRSWNSYPCEQSSATKFRGGDILTDDVMKQAMHGVLDKTREVNGTKTSLAELGYNYVSMDDGWQQCNCSTHQDIDPTLPNCSIGDCRAGMCSWHKDGIPQVNLHRFPDMKSMVDYGHSLGLKVGTYLNNCICMEQATPNYEKDVAWLVGLGFDGVKIDNCGSAHNVTYYSELFNKSGRYVRIEDCHTYPTHPDWMKDGTLSCPMNMYRSGGDISASFGSIIGEVLATIQYNDLDVPMSRPGCWAYPDMMQVGNFNGQTALQDDYTHFGLWTIVSAPLVLGFNLSDQVKVDTTWPIITNPHALRVNKEWVGQPGTLVKAYPDPASTLTGLGDCSSTKGGWHADASKKQIISPSGMCLSSNKAGNACPPATRYGGITNCGLQLIPCTNATAQGSWEYKDHKLQYMSTKKGSQMSCVYVQPGGLNQTKHTRGSNQMGTGQCIDGQANQVIMLNDGKLVVNETGSCIVESSGYGAHLWWKPIKNNQHAILVVNVLEVNHTVNVDVANDVPGLKCAGASCPMIDVWNHKSGMIPASGKLTLDLKPHESMYYILG